MTDSNELRKHWVDRAWESAGPIPAFRAQGHLSVAERAAYGIEAVLEILRDDADRHACEEPELLSQRVRSGLIDAAGVLAESIAAQLCNVRDASATTEPNAPRASD